MLFQITSLYEWIKKIWYIYTVGYYSVVKKEQNKAIYSNVDARRDYLLSEVLKRKTNTI